MTYDPETTISVTEFYGNNKVVKRTQKTKHYYEKNAAGLLLKDTEKKIYDSSDATITESSPVVLYTMTYEYNNQNELKSITTEYSSSKDVSEFDENGYCIKINFYSSSGTLTEYYEHEYNSEGQILKRSVYDSNSELTEYITINFYEE